MRSRALADGAKSGVPRTAQAPDLSEAPRAAALTAAQEEAFKRAALRAVVACAGTERVGFPSRVVPLTDKAPVWGCPAQRIDFTHTRSTSRVCPVTRIEHDSNHFFVALCVEEERTGIPAFFVYCHSTKECNPDKRHKMKWALVPSPAPLDDGYDGKKHSSGPLGPGTLAGPGVGYCSVSY
jgi:hypothetical protein